MRSQDHGEMASKTNKATIEYICHYHNDSLGLLRQRYNFGHLAVIQIIWRNFDTMSGTIVEWTNTN